VIYSKLDIRSTRSLQIHQWTVRFLVTMLPIIHLPDTDSQLIQSSISLPTYPSALKELLDNAIDAQASHIDCWINPSSWSIRVVDDGFGINKEDLKGQLGCARGMSSKVALGELSGADRASDRFLGFRGQGESSFF
jgi:DNA mismatch repair ATPase MutL